MRRRDLQGACNVAHEVAQEDEAALEQPQHQEVAFGVGRRDGRAKLLNALRDVGRIESDALDGAPVEPRIRGRSCRSRP
jgi:hypothetical protein